MSGHKKATITISQKEYQRLHKNELRMRFLREPVQEDLEQLQHQAQDAYLGEISDLQSRQHDFERTISNFDGYLRELESETSRALQEHQVELNETLLRTAEQSWNDTRRALKNQDERTKAFLKDLAASVEEQFSRLTGQIRDIQSNQTLRAEKVRQWLQQAGQMLEFIQAHYQHEKFAPGEVSSQVQTFQLVQENYKNGFLETALAQSQQIYLVLSNLRLRLESHQHHFNLLLEVARQNIEKLYLLAEENRTMPALDLDGNETDTLLDVDYWSARKLGRLIGQIQGLSLSLSTAPESLSTEEISYLIDEKLPALQQELEEIIYQARLNALNSQLRINIADLVLQALETQGYSVAHAQYLNKDMRQEFQVQVENMQGNQVLIQVIPNQGFENELQLHALHQTATTRHEMQQQTLEISRALNYFGLSLGPVTEMDHTNPNPQPLPGRNLRRVNPEIEKISWKQTRTH